MYGVYAELHHFKTISKHRCVSGIPTYVQILLILTHRPCVDRDSHLILHFENSLWLDHCSTLTVQAMDEVKTMFDLFTEFSAASLAPLQVTLKSF